MCIIIWNDNSLCSSSKYRKSADFGAAFQNSQLLCLGGVFVCLMWQSQPGKPSTPETFLLLDASALNSGLRSCRGKSTGLKNRIPFCDLDTWKRRNEQQPPTEHNRPSERREQLRASQNTQIYTREGWGLSGVGVGTIPLHWCLQKVWEQHPLTNTHSLAGPRALFRVWHCSMLSFPLPLELKATVKISFKKPQTNKSSSCCVWREKLGTSMIRICKDLWGMPVWNLLGHDLTF